MPRVPLLAGSGLVVVNAPDDAVVLAPPPPPLEGVADAAGAVRDALRFPLEGKPLEALVARGSRVTIVVEPPHLPIPGSPADPRREALEGVSDELARLGVPTQAQTLLVAGGLARRVAARDLQLLVSPEFGRRFHGRLIVHDVEDSELVELGAAANVPLRINRALVEADAVVVVTAAETVVHGGPAALLAAGGPEALRSAGTDSLLQTAASRGWQDALALERLLSQRVPLVGVSLVLNQPRLLAATLRDFPYRPEAVAHLGRLPLRLAFSLVPPPLRSLVVRSLRREVTAAAAFAGPPAVAHAEALLRAIDAREAVLDGRLDVLVLGIPPTTPYLPRERPNPLLAAYLGLGLALRLWRDAFPVAEGGTAILAHPFHRRFPHPSQQPYRIFFQALRSARDPDELQRAERGASADQRGLAGYRDGRTCHPLLPFADWAACGPALSHLGSVLVAGCRDAVAARQLGLVPTRSVGAALAMARGSAGATPRVGVMLSPPYFPLRVAT